ncbi:prolyl endopeptidase FAP isoform X2 [Nematostella vectensis]|uniref:prolyl endopeptidase FAP isoform X2 n=1 Tax=Nematostella vectensis TaxID=45351 RepID=UPI00207708E3|nr:prolyl endopeptidase FAP isoform X2 [Nematostella vectensis]
MRLNRKQKLLCILVIVFLLAVTAIVLVVVLTGRTGSTKSPAPSPTSLNRFTERDWFSGKFSPRYSAARWLSDTEYLERDGRNALIRSLETNRSTLLIPYPVLRNLSASVWSFSADRQWALLTTNYQKNYRHSFSADFYGYNVHTGQVVRFVGPDENKRVQLVVWGNTGSVVAFVQSNNIFYQGCANCTRHTLTTNGETNKIYNGVPDWVYEEDVYGTNFAMWFSPDDSYLGYGEFNDTLVTWFSYIYYGPNKDAYTEVKKLAYPKPGYNNPQVKAMLVNLTALPNVTINEISPPSELETVDRYFTNMGWVDNSRVLVSWANRIQNISIRMICDVTTMGCQENRRQAVTNGWVSSSTYLGKHWISKDASYYLTLFPFAQGVHGKFTHLAKVTLPSDKPGVITNLTHGTWDVMEITGFDPDNEIVYFSSSETSPRDSHIYSISLKTAKKTCLSCSLAWSQSGRCKYFVALFSEKASWYNLICYGPGAPISSRHSTKGFPSSVLEDNQKLLEHLTELALPKRRDFKFNSGGYEIEAQEILPPNFDENKKYAVLFDVYGGPASQKVVNTFSLSFNEYLVSNFDIIIVKLDARGTRNRGERFKHAVYKKLGEYEAEDTINAGKYMQAKPYVDKNKLAIWGWSYGGYLTTYVLSKNTSVFKVGMAVAPVTDWHYYDTAYTERYMGLLPQDKEGYEYTSLLSRAKQFANVSYLIVHGSADDNVHYQHTAQMVKALAKANIKFRVQYYTDKAHSIRGLSGHLYGLLTRFLTTKLDIAKNP